MLTIQQNFLEMEVRFFCASRIVQLKCHLNSISNSHSLVGNVVHIHVKHIKGYITGFTYLITDYLFASFDMHINASFYFWESRYEFDIMNALGLHTKNGKHSFA